ncbi:het-domain-containing protein [Fusarium phyllophilum]|uniref:Het-domain-containing protein n=1 Tax=Fusarium phyllophilum TaxID=47803 RepID=A0A8H5NG13_9HYPO|nr:het-domain-containing protein [Fusarium phyllophilum]
MADYYGNALLTIAADTVPDTAASCFPKATSQPIVISIADSPTKVKVAKIPLHVSMKSIRFEKNPPLCMPLFSRAWAFQERLMSVRTLHLGPEELVWECSSELRCECGMAPDIWNGRPERSIQPFRVSHYNALASGTDLGEYWHDLIEMYLIRQLTFGSDKLNAIMGLAKQINNSQNANSPPLSNYILGLWSSSLENALLWSKGGTGYSRNSQFPSWSWASIGGTWLYQRPPPFPEFVSKATILRTPAESWTIDPTKEACSYRLVISGYAADAVLAPYNFSPGKNQVQWTLRTGFDCDSDMELIVGLDIDLSYKKGDQATEVTCLQLGVSEIRSKRRSWGLVLRATTHNNAEFERIGIMTASENWYDTISKRRDIELV